MIFFFEFFFLSFLFFFLSIIILWLIALAIIFFCIIADPLFLKFWHFIYYFFLMNVDNIFICFMIFYFLYIFLNLIFLLIMFFYFNFHFCLFALIFLLTIFCIFLILNFLYKRFNFFYMKFKFVRYSCIYDPTTIFFFAIATLAFMQLWVATIEVPFSIPPESFQRVAPVPREELIKSVGDIYKDMAFYAFIVVDDSYAPTLIFSKLGLLSEYNNVDFFKYDYDYPKKLLDQIIPREPEFSAAREFFKSSGVLQNQTFTESGMWKVIFNYIKGEDLISNLNHYEIVAINAFAYYNEPDLLISTDPFIKFYYYCWNNQRAEIEILLAKDNNKIFNLLLYELGEIFPKEN